MKKKQKKFGKRLLALMKDSDLPIRKITEVLADELVTLNILDLNNDEAGGCQVALQQLAVVAKSYGVTFAPRTLH